MFETYKPSGRFGFLSIFLALIGIIVAIALSYVYHLALHWIPLTYVSFLATLALAFLLGSIGSKIVKVGKIRNVPLAFTLGLLLTVTALGGKFFFQYQQAIDDTVVDLLNDPEHMESDPAELREALFQSITFVDYIKARVGQGWNVGRGGNGAQMSGVFVYLVWLIEFGIIVWSAVRITYMAAQEPFSEKLGEWASEAEVVMTLPVTNKEMVSQIESASTVDELLEIPIPKTDQSSEFAIYRVNSIPGQELEDAYLSVDLTKLSFDKEGNEKWDTSFLVRHAVFSTDQRKQLIENAELLNEAMADYRESIEAEQLAANDDSLETDSGQRTAEESDEVQ